MNEKNQSVERLLYLTLGLVFIGVSIAMIVLLVFGNKLDTQVTTLKQIQQTQITQVQQLKASVAELKANNERNTEYLRCLLALHAHGVPNDDSCDAPAGINAAGTSVVQLPSTQQGNAVSQPTPRPSATPSPSPAPAEPPASTAPWPTGLQQVIQAVDNLLSSVLR